MQPRRIGASGVDRPASTPVQPSVFPVPADRPGFLKVPTEPAKTLRRQPSLRSQLNQIRLWVRQGRTERLDRAQARRLDRAARALQARPRPRGRRARPSRLRQTPCRCRRPSPRATCARRGRGRGARGAEEPDEARGASRVPRPQRRRRPAAKPGPRRRRAASRAGATTRRDRAGGRPGRAEEERRGRRSAARAAGAVAAAAVAAGAVRSTYEATFDHGEEGYGLWLDPAVVDNPVYAEHWAGQRAVVVVFDRDTITIRRAGAEEPPTGPRTSSRTPTPTATATIRSSGRARRRSRRPRACTGRTPRRRRRLDPSARRRRAALRIVTSSAQSGPPVERRQLRHGERRPEALPQLVLQGDDGPAERAVESGLGRVSSRRR